MNQNFKQLGLPSVNDAGTKNVLKWVFILIAVSLILMAAGYYVGLALYYFTH